MAGSDYVPLNLPGCSLPLIAGAALTAGQLVYYSADETVLPTSAATAAVAGVAAQTVPSGQTVTVYRGGVHLLAASGAIAVGAAVIAAAAGAVATIASDTTYDQVVGTAQAAAANGFVRVVLHGV